jgi:hypothetical protein
LAAACAASFLTAPDAHQGYRPGPRSHLRQTTHSSAGSRRLGLGSRRAATAPREDRNRYGRCMIKPLVRLARSRGVYLLIPHGPSPWSTPKTYIVVIRWGPWHARAQAACPYPRHCQKFARNRATHDSTTPYPTTLNSARSPLRLCGTRGPVRRCEPPAHRW